MGGNRVVRYLRRWLPFWGHCVLVGGAGGTTLAVAIVAAVSPELAPLYYVLLDVSLVYLRTVRGTGFWCSRCSARSGRSRPWASVDRLSAGTGSPISTHFVPCGRMAQNARNAPRRLDLRGAFCVWSPLAVATVTAITGDNLPPCLPGGAPVPSRRCHSDPRRRLPRTPVCPGRRAPGRRRRHEREPGS